MARDGTVRAGWTRRGGEDWAVGSWLVVVARLVADVRRLVVAAWSGEGGGGASKWPGMSWMETACRSGVEGHGVVCRSGRRWCGGWWPVVVDRGGEAWFGVS